MPAKRKTSATKAVATRSANGNLPAELMDEFADVINRDRATVVASTGWPIIRTSPGGFSLSKQPLPQPLPLIVLGGIRQNVLFEGSYDPSRTSLPTCAALDLDGDESTMAPPEGIGKSASCEKCPFNAWGSGAGSGKACKNQLKLAVFPFDESIDYTKGSRGALLNLPPTALKKWAVYASEITEAQGRPLLSVVTNFQIENLSQGFTVTPSFGGYLNDADTLRALRARAEGDARKALEQLPPLDGEGGDAEPAPAKGGVRRRKIQR